MKSNRKAAALTKTELAMLAGVRVDTILRMEVGAQMPSIPVFDRICVALSQS